MNSLDERMDYLLRNISDNFFDNIKSQEIIFRRGVLYHDDFFGNLKRIGYFKLNDTDIYESKLPLSIENMISNTFLEKDRMFHKNKKLQLYFYVMNKEDSFDQIIKIYKDSNLEIYEYNEHHSIMESMYKMIFPESIIRITKIFEECDNSLKTCYLIHFYKNKKSKQHFIVKSKKLNFLCDDLFCESLSSELNKKLGIYFSPDELKNNMEDCFKIIRLQMY